MANLLVVASVMLCALAFPATLAARPLVDGAGANGGREQSRPYPCRLLSQAITASAAQLGSMPRSSIEQGKGLEVCAAGGVEQGFYITSSHPATTLGRFGRGRALPIGSE
jgi:hypothetical protein